MRKESTDQIDKVRTRIFETLTMRGMDQLTFAKACGVSVQVVIGWRTKRSSSFMKYLDQVAYVLNVPVAYLLTGEMDIDDVQAFNVEPISDDERQLIQELRQLSPRAVGDILAIIEHITQYQSMFDNTTSE